MCRIRWQPSTYNPSRPGYKQEDVDMQALNQGVYNLLGGEVVYELEMRTGIPLVIRIQWSFKADPISSSWAVKKISREVAVLKLLQCVSPQVPAPRVHTSDFALKNTVGAPFMIMNRLYGEGQWMAWPKLSADDRWQITFVKSLATSLVGIFNVCLPSIGSLETLTPDGLPIIASILPHMTLLPTEQCATLEQIRTLGISVIPRPAMLVPVLVHMDLNNQNIMVKDSTVSGIVDWVGQGIPISYVTMPLMTLSTAYNLV
ncbi:hypothetical protein BU17DRAFT_69544 [Hysterangium stoloniferum]|nr:hypothetical protein BU17DRAFT_69544 [Hysterangium stoloniferum]